MELLRKRITYTNLITYALLRTLFKEFKKQVTKKEKTFANHIRQKAYQEQLKNSQNSKIKHSIFSMVKRFEETLHQKIFQMSNDHTKRYLTSLIPIGDQIRSTVKYHIYYKTKILKILIISNDGKNANQQEFSYFAAGNVKSFSQPQRTIWLFLMKLNTHFM